MSALGPLAIPRLQPWRSRGARRLPARPQSSPPIAVASGGENKTGNADAADDQQQRKERELASRAALIRLERLRLDREEAALRLEAASISSSSQKQNKDKKKKEAGSSTRRAVDDALKGKTPSSPSSSYSSFPPQIYPPRGPHSELVTERVRRDRATRPRRVAELLSLIESGQPLPPDPRVPAELLSAAETGIEFRGRLLRSRAEAELALLAEDEDEQRRRAGGRGRREQESEKRALGVLRAAAKDAEDAARARALEREKVEARERRRSRRRREEEADDDFSSDDDEEGETPPVPLSVTPLEAREPVPAPRFPPAVEAAFERSRRAAALVRRAGILRSPRALARLLIEAGLVAEGERGDESEEEEDKEGDPNPNLLSWRDDLAAGLGSGGWLSLWGALDDAGCSLDVVGVWVHASDCPEAEEEELREKEMLAAQAQAQAQVQAAKEGNPPPPLAFPRPSRFLERFVPAYTVCADCWLTVPLSPRTVSDLQRWRAFCSPAGAPRRRRRSNRSLRFDAPESLGTSSPPSDSEGEEGAEEEDAPPLPPLRARLSSFAADRRGRPPPFSLARELSRRENLMKSRLLPGIRDVQAAAALAAEAVAADLPEGGEKRERGREKAAFRLLRGGSAEAAALAAAAAAAASERPPVPSRERGGGTERPEGGGSGSPSPSPSPVLLPPARPLFSRPSLSSDFAFPSLALRLVVWAPRRLPAEREEEEEEEGEELHPLEFFGHSRPAPAAAFSFDALAVLFSLRGRGGPKGPLPLKKWAHRPMREREERDRERRARARVHERRTRGGSDGGESDEEDEIPLPPAFDPETSVFAFALADVQRQASVERGEAFSIALHLSLEFDGGGIFGGGAEEGEGEGEGEEERAEEAATTFSSSPPPSPVRGLPLPPPIRIINASSRWLATVSTYPLSGAEAGDVVREAVGLFVGGGGGRRRKSGGGGEGGSGSGSGRGGSGKKKDLARSLALSGAVLPRRPGEGLSL